MTKENKENGETGRYKLGKFWNLIQEVVSPFVYV